MHTAKAVARTLIATRRRAVLITTVTVVTIASTVIATVAIIIVAAGSAARAWRPSTAMRCRHVARKIDDDAG